MNLAIFAKMFSMTRIFLICFIFINVNLFGQVDSLPKEKIFIKSLNPIKKSTFQTDSISAVVGLSEIKDEKIDLLIQDYMDSKKIMGYRIQIFSSDLRPNAMKKRMEFMNLYPSNRSYLDYQAPNFKVRVGDYSERLKVYKELELIQENFPSAFVVQCEIEPIIN